MIELIIGTYGVLCWLLFKKFKLIPVTTYTVCTAILGGLILALGIFALLALFHPQAKDGRMYAYTTPIVPQVRGLVIESLSEGQHVKKGDPLFRIDPQPYQIEVDRLEASLADSKSLDAQRQEQLSAAEAVTSQARSQLLTAESEFNREAIQEVEQAKSVVTSAKARYDLTYVELQRESELVEKKLVPQSQYDATKGKFDVAKSSLEEAQAALRQATEKAQSGGDRVQSAREQLSIAQAQERSARLAAEADIEGINPQVRQIMSELEDKQWDLDQTVVRAPANGYVTQVLLRPGQMVVPLPLTPPMVFVHDEKMVLAASFNQNVIKEFEAGLEAELAFKSHPGRIFKAKLYRTLPIIPEGQLTAGGQLRTLTAATAPGRIPVIFEYGNDVAELNVPAGAQVYVAVYTHKVHALSIVRKILLRIKSWENYISFH